MTFGRKFETADDVKAREDRAHAERVRKARVELARGNRAWTEHEQVDLVRRGPYLVSATSDEMFMVRPGHAFGPRSANVEFVTESTQLHFFVDQSGSVVLLERVDRPRYWSDAVAKNPRLAARA